MYRFVLLRLPNFRLLYQARRANWILQRTEQKFPGILEVSTGVMSPTQPMRMVSSSACCPKFTLLDAGDLATAASWVSARLYVTESVRNFVPFPIFGKPICIGARSAEAKVLFLENQVWHKHTVQSL